MIAGVIANFLLAIFAFGLVYSFAGIPRQTKEVKVVEIVSGSPAQIGGLLVGDVIKRIYKVEIYSVEQFVSLIEAKKGKKITMETQRGKITLVSRLNPPQGEGPLGVTITNTEIYFPPSWQKPFYGVYYGFKDAVFWGENVVLGLVKVFGELFGGKAPSDLAGPIGIFAVTSQAAKFWILGLINFVGVLSVNLAILNFFPFPALDGGRLLFIGIEKVIGRKVLQKLENAIHTVGMAILLALILVITAHDIQRLIKAGGISGFLDPMIK